MNRTSNPAGADVKSCVKKDFKGESQRMEGDSKPSPLNSTERTRLRQDFLQTSEHLTGFRYVLRTPGPPAAEM